MLHRHCGILGAGGFGVLRMIQDLGCCTIMGMGLLGNLGCWGGSSGAGALSSPPRLGPPSPPRRSRKAALFLGRKKPISGPAFFRPRGCEKGGAGQSPPKPATPPSPPQLPPPPPLSGAGGGTEGALGGQTEGRGGGGGGVEGGTDGQTDSTPTDPPPVPPPPQFLTGGRGEWPVVAAWPRPPAAIGCGPFPPFPRRFMNERGGGAGGGAL